MKHNFICKSDIFAFSSCLYSKSRLIRLFTSLFTPYSWTYETTIHVTQYFILYTHTIYYTQTICDGLCTWKIYMLNLHSYLSRCSIISFLLSIYLYIHTRIVYSVQTNIPSDHVVCLLYHTMHILLVWYENKNICLIKVFRFSIYYIQNECINLCVPHIV